jgi:hypothetical protein
MRILLAVLIAASMEAATPEFEQRLRAVIDAWAHPKGPGEPGYAAVAARLWLHEDAAWCSRRLEALLADGPSGDMFWMYPTTAIAYLDRGQLSAPARAALRRAWKTYMPYRGDTENHFLLYYTSLIRPRAGTPGSHRRRTSRNRAAGSSPGCV